MALNTREREVLDLERDWWQVAPTKKEAIRERLGCSDASYYATLRRLAGSPDAFDYSPLVVQRLRARLARRRQERWIGATPGDGSRRSSRPPASDPGR